MQSVIAEVDEDVTCDGGHGRGGVKQSLRLINRRQRGGAHERALRPIFGKRIGAVNYTSFVRRAHVRRACHGEPLLAMRVV